jgi:hypothetical protein
MRLGTYCRGGPPWPPLGLSTANSGIYGLGFREHDFHAGPATEGRPYSTFRKSLRDMPLTSQEKAVAQKVGF